ncbi:hypothetical protein [Weissella ceti]|uniref:hypothetical protein n=1 Tax=Weissella ceti TaxID=759620 RepID=UPI001185D548|nr:hypothetical protein [Weissella ceti]
MENKEAAYTNYYGPLLEFLSHYQLRLIHYGILRASISAQNEHPDIHIDTRSQDLVRENMKYLPSNTGAKIHTLVMSSDMLFYQRGDDFERYETNARNASDSFDFIIIESLKEADKLAKTLGYPRIAKKLLSEFEKSLEKYPENRHLVNPAKREQGHC